MGKTPDQIVGTIKVDRIRPCVRQQLESQGSVFV